MKKTILAIAIPALFASAANAAVVYDKDGTSLISTAVFRLTTTVNTPILSR
jgi:outer membrane protein N